VSITVDTAAAETDLTVKATVKTEMSISGSGDDDFIDALITQVSAAIRKYCGRKFERESITETLPGSGTSRLFLTRTPIVSVTSVTVDNAAVASDEWTIEDADAGFLLRHDDGAPPAPEVWALPGMLQWGLSRARVKESGSNNITIVYVSGYLLPGEGSRTLPEDVERACIDTVKALYQGRKDSTRLKSQKVGDASEVIDIATGLSPTSEMLLNCWRRSTVF